MQDPEPYLEALKIRVPDIMAKGQPVFIDSTMRIFVGHDIFYFSDPADRDRFQKDPLRYVKRLTDPVTLRRFAASRRSPWIVWKGRPYYFASAATRARFAVAPDSFAVRKGM